MDYVSPPELMADAVELAKRKASLSIRDMLLRGTLAGVLLGYATSLVIVVLSQGLLCNWMVTRGAMLALTSRSTLGKIAAMWLPIMIFFALGYEHSVVNMFLVPAGMLLGAPVSLRQWWLWNQIPVTLGNLLSGALCTGAAMYLMYAAKPKLIVKDKDKLELHEPMPAPVHSLADAV